MARRTSISLIVSGHHVEVHSDFQCDLESMADVPFASRGSLETTRSGGRWYHIGFQLVEP